MPLINALTSMKMFANKHSRTFAYLITITYIYLLASQYMALTLGG